jgi:hypothetical protein
MSVPLPGDGGEDVTIVEVPGCEPAALAPRLVAWIHGTGGNGAGEAKKTGVIWRDHGRRRDRSGRHVARLTGCTGMRATS